MVVNKNASNSAPSFKELNNLFTRNLLSKPNFDVISFFFFFSVKESEGPQEVLVPHLSLRILVSLGSRISVTSNRALHFAADSCNYNHQSAQDHLRPIQSLISGFRISFNKTIFMWEVNNVIILVKCTRPTLCVFVSYIPRPSRQRQNNIDLW